MNEANKFMPAPYRSASQVRFVEITINEDERDKFKGIWNFRYQVDTCFVNDHRGIGGWDVSGEGITVQGEPNDYLQLVILKWLLLLKSQKQKE